MPKISHVGRCPDVHVRSSVAANVSQAQGAAEISIILRVGHIEGAKHISRGAVEVVDPALVGLYQILRRGANEDFSPVVAGNIACRHRVTEGAVVCGAGLLSV